MEGKNYSEEAQWFLRNLQRLQDDFAESIGAQIVATDKNGELLTKMSGQQKICQIIQGTEKGKQGCQGAYQTALSLVKSMKEPAFMNCPVGLASLWVPIKVRGEVVGSITGCGGRYDNGESEEELREKFTIKADELEIMEKDKEIFFNALSELKVITEEEMRKRAERLARLVSILAEETALSEVFGVDA